MSKNRYVISFLVKNINWVSISSIDKETFYSFIKHLYLLKRKIVILPYLCGGFLPPMRPVLDKDKTYVVQNIVEDIKNKVPVHEMLNHRFDIRGNGIFDDIHFNEDVYEYLLSLGVNEKEALLITDSNHYERNTKEVKEKLTKMKDIDQRKVKRFIKWLDSKPGIAASRWMFIYMFRNEFKKYMSDKGYKVCPVGGWVLNNKKREIDIGLIDKYGNLF